MEGGGVGHGNWSSPLPSEASSDLGRPEMAVAHAFGTFEGFNPMGSLYRQVYQAPPEGPPFGERILLLYALVFLDPPQTTTFMAFMEGPTGTSSRLPPFFQTQNPSTLLTPQLHVFSWFVFPARFCLFLITCSLLNSCGCFPPFN